MAKKASGGRPREAKPEGGGARKRPGGRWREAGTGFILGMLFWHAGMQIGLAAFPLFRAWHLVPVAGVLGALLGMTRFRNLLWIATGLLCALLLTVAYTPIAKPLIAGLIRSDRLQRVEAVVVLASNIQPDGDLTDAAQVRLLQGYEVLRQGYARRLILTRLKPPRKPYRPTVEQQMRRLGLEYPVEEIGRAESGYIVNTHDEAVAVARLAQERGWGRVILVSEPTHMRRAAAVFEKAGVRVLCSPCGDTEYDTSSLRQPDERVRAFRDWLYEVAGYEWYRLRGRI